MSTSSPNPAEEPGTPPAPGPEPADTPATPEPAAVPAPGAAADASPPEEPAVTPPVAEILVTPAAEQPPDIPLAGEPADVPPAAGPGDVPAGDYPEGEYPAGDEDVAEPPLAQLVRKASLGQLIVMVTGVLLFIWGFLPWYSDPGGSANAWSTVTIPGLLLTATWVPLLSLAITIFVAIKVFFDGFPDRVLGFTWAQLAMVAGLFDVLITLGFLVANRRLGDLGSLDIGTGLILSFITALVLLTGAVLDHFGVDAEAFGRLRPPANRPPR